MTNEWSFSEIFERALGHFQEIIRSEVRLAKTEVREEAVKAGKSGITIGAGAVASFYALGLLLASAVAGLSMVWPVWLAALVIGVAMALIGGLTIAAGTRKARQVHPKPEKTIRSIKENMEWARHQIR